MTSILFLNYMWDKQNHLVQCTGYTMKKIQDGVSEL